MQESDLEMSTLHWSLACSCSSVLACFWWCWPWISRLCPFELLPQTLEVCSWAAQVWIVLNWGMILGVPSSFLSVTGFSFFSFMCWNRWCSWLTWMPGKVALVLLINSFLSLSYLWYMCDQQFAECPMENPTPHPFKKICYFFTFIFTIFKCVCIHMGAHRSKRCQFPWSWS